MKNAIKLGFGIVLGSELAKLVVKVVSGLIEQEKNKSKTTEENK